MRLAGVTTALLLVFATKGHMSQIHPDYQSLESVTLSSSYIVTARPYLAPIYKKDPTLLSKMSRKELKKVANYRVEVVLLGGKDVKTGDLIRVGQANESFNEYMGEAQEKGLPMPSVSFPFYQSTSARRAEDPVILFLIGTDPSQRVFNLFCDGSEESIDSMEVVKGYLKGLDSK